MKQISVMILGIIIAGSMFTVYAIDQAIAQQNIIPSWVKGIAGFWSEDKISDSEFMEALEFLIENDVLNPTIPRVQELEAENQQLRLEIEALELEIENNLRPDPVTPTPSPPTNTGNTIIINNAPGSSVSGCEDTEEGCFIPSVATVDVGGKVIFSNTDNVAHTSVSGLISDDNSGSVFDSSLLLPGNTYEWSPTKVGEYPYFCIVHPWMIGTIIVVP